MNLVLTVLEIVAPVFLLAAIGFFWVKAGYEYRVKFVTQLAMTLSVPCLIFTALMRTDIDPQTLVGCVAGHRAGLCTGHACGLSSGQERRASICAPILAPLIFGNTGNLGLPLALFAFGDEGLAMRSWSLRSWGSIPSPSGSGWFRAADRR